MSNGNKFVEGLTIGGILGFVFGLLSAPKPGSELRKQLLNESEDLYKQATESVADIKVKTNQAITALQAKGEELVKTAAETFPVKKDGKDSRQSGLDRQSEGMTLEGKLPPHLN